MPLDISKIEKARTLFILHYYDQFDMDIPIATLSPVKGVGGGVTGLVGGGIPPEFYINEGYCVYDIVDENEQRIQKTEEGIYLFRADCVSIPPEGRYNADVVAIFEGSMQRKDTIKNNEQFHKIMEQENLEQKVKVYMTQKENNSNSNDRFL